MVLLLHGGERVSRGVEFFGELRHFVFETGDLAKVGALERKKVN